MSSPPDPSRPPSGEARYARIALDVPIGAWFDYGIPAALAPSLGLGSWVLVPWGRGRRVGLVVGFADAPGVDPERVRPIGAMLEGAPPAPAAWLDLIRFAAAYYHRGLGEVALPALPKLLRTPPAARSRGSAFERARRRAGAAAKATPGAPDGAAPGLPTPGGAAAEPPTPGGAARPDVALTGPQARALESIQAGEGFRVFLLHGITGSGKTEVYLRWLDAVLARDPRAQVLMLVPEIALTPQLAAQVSARFGAAGVAILHSDLPEGERAAHWLAAADGRARVVVGTRLAVLAPLPNLAAIVVDEEHDPSYKQQEGVHYSARDLAIVAASQRRIPVVLGSATPSLESWLSVRRGRFTLLELPDRATGAALPSLRLVDLRRKTLQHGLAAETAEAIAHTLARGERALVFMNRRGYAPVLTCDACGWVSQCGNCSAFRVLHRASGSRPGPAPRGGAAGAAQPADGRQASTRYRLVCHHCAAEQPVPRACPDCGNVDLKPLGRGTQRLEEGLRELFPQAAIARLDRDVARRRGAAQSVLDAAHAGEVDILVGTQLLAKGHDFRRLTLVVVVDADGGLYSSDFRAPERLFATLMQVSGRAGRDAASSTVLVQTRFPEHPLFEFLRRHDYAGFADAQLAERRGAGLPPFAHQAILRAEAKTLAGALGFLAHAKAAAPGPDDLPPPDGGDPAAHAVQLCDPVPMPMMRIAGRERAQLLVESGSRKALHAFIDAWLPRLAATAPGVRWQLEVDPLEI